MTGYTKTRLAKVLNELIEKENPTDLERAILYCLNGNEMERNFFSVRVAAAELADKNAVIEAARRLRKITHTIFVVTQNAGIRSRQIECPHGNIPNYPSHAWWCDGCFQELEQAEDELAAALAKLDGAK